MMDAALVSLTSSLHHSTLNSFPTVSTPSTDITFFPEQQVDFIAITPDGEQFQPPAHHHTYSLIESAVKHGSGRENIGSSGVTGTDTPWIDQDWDIGDNQESVLITDYDDANAHSYQAGATSGGKAVNGVNNTSANHSVQQYNFGTSSSASFSNTHSQQYNLGTSTSASASNTHSGPTQVPVDESHYHSGNGQVSSFTHYIHRDDSSSVPATDSGGGSSSMAVTNSTGCFGYDDVFNYSFYGGSQFTCPNDTTDTELIKTYALAVPMATMKNSPAKKVVPREPQSVGGTAPMTPGRNMRTVLDLAQAEAVTDSDSISKASPSHFVLACHALTLAGIQGAAKGDVQGKNFKENATKNAEAVTPVGAHFLRRVFTSLEVRSLAEVVDAHETRQMYVINPAQGPLVILDYELSQEYFGMEHEEVVFLLSCMYSPHEDWDAIVAQNFKRELQSNEDDTSNLLFF